jgi:hypothetical protein
MSGYLTTRQLGPFLREKGYPIGDSTIKKATLPSRSGGPPAVGFFGQRKLFDPDQVLAWAKASLATSKRAFPTQRINEKTQC